MSFFYADIKTDELTVHGHNAGTPGKIEILDADSSNMITLRAPNVLTSNVVITLPNSNGVANSIMSTSDDQGTLEYVTPNGDLSLAGSGQFTVNGISNTATVTSMANIEITNGKSLWLGSESVRLYNANSNLELVTSDIGGSINLMAGNTGIIRLDNGSGALVFNSEGANNYINVIDGYGTGIGPDGYGLKTANGTLQFKNASGNTWLNVGTDTLALLADVSLSGLANNNVLTYSTVDSRWHNTALPSGYYGAFSDTTIQTNNTAASYNIMRLNTTDEAFGVSVLNNSQVTVEHSAVYNIQFSAQLDKTDPGDDIVNIWLLKNGTAVSNTDTEITVVGNGGKAIAAWNYVLTLAADDYVELAWISADANLRLFSNVAVSPAPAIPSVIVTVTQVAYALGGTSNFFAELLDVNTAGKSNNSIVQYNANTSKWEAKSNLTLNTGDYIKWNSGSIANINGTSAGNVVITASNVDIVVTSEAHIHNNLRVTGNIYLDGNYSSNISGTTTGNLDIRSGNVNILSTTETRLTGPVRLATGPLYLDGGYLANISCPSTSNLVINAANLNLAATGYLNIQGNTQIFNTSSLAFRDGTTLIQSGVAGNLDIKSIAGNVNITANHDVVITTNSASTIRFVGPNGSSPMNLSFQGSNTYMNFGSTVGPSGSGIRFDGSNVQVGSSGAWSGISNTTLSIAGRQVSLGGSNTIGFSDLTGTVTNGQLANSVITIGTSTLDLGSSYVGLDVSNSIGYQTSNLVGTITNAQLAGSITNDKLSNTTITIGNQAIALGSAGNIGMSNLSDVNVGSVANKDVLTYDTTTTKWIPLAGSFFIPSNITTVSTSNTYTPIPSGTRAMRIRAVGAGGGGGGISGVYDSAGGGGSGGYGEVYVNLLGPGMTNFTFVRSVIGVGGTGGAAASAAGTAGAAGGNSNIYLTNTNVGIVITNKILEVGGGSGGALSYNGTPPTADGRGGPGGSAAILSLGANSSVYGYGLTGTSGLNGLLTDDPNLRYTSAGNGGNSLFGPGGLGATPLSSSVAGISGGGGGGGAHFYNLTPPYKPGAAGGNGFAIIEFF